jgi:hypothetical protein
MVFFHKKKKKKKTLLVVISTSVFVSTHLVKYSTITKINYLLLEAFYNGLSLSIPHCKKTHEEVMMVNSVKGWWVTKANL